MNGPAGDRPRATPLRVAPGKARGHVVYSQDETQHAAGRLLTTLRSLIIVHIQPPGLGVGTSEAHPSWSSAPSMVWPPSPSAMLCSWRVSCPLDAPAGPKASSFCPTS